VDTSLHASDERLELYALQRLSGWEVEGIEEHLLICQSCVRRLEEIGAFAHAMRAELEARPAPAESRRLNWFGWLQPRFAITGALALALLALGIYRVGGGARLVPVASLELTSMRGEMPTLGLAREIDLTFMDAPPAGGPFRAEVVDSSGTSVWSGTPQMGDKGPEARVHNRLSPGDYFVRLFSAKGQLLHEYGFHLARK
jgi:hypothetical protein